jgi:hypothetical protein
LLNTYGQGALSDDTPGFRKLGEPCAETVARELMQGGHQLGGNF